MIELSDISHVGSEAIMNEQEGLNVRSDVEGAAEAGNTPYCRGSSCRTKVVQLDRALSLGLPLGSVD